MFCPSFVVIWKAHSDICMDVNCCQHGLCTHSRSLPNCDKSVCRDGNVSLQEYMAFMISRETENVKSSEEIESAFRALSTENKPYVTKEELYQVRCVYYLLCKSSFNSSCKSHRVLLPFRIWPRSRRTTASHTWSPTSTARVESCHRLSTLSNSLARFSSIDPSPTSDQSGCVFPPHTHINTNTRLNLHDYGTRNTH